MKRFFLFFVCLLSVSVVSHSMKIHGPLKKIHLQGILDNSSPKSGVQPVEAYQFEDYLQVIFLTELGSLNIEVADEAGEPVFQTTVNATSGSELYIDAESWNNGEYTLLIANGTGGYLIGKFVIN